MLPNIVDVNVNVKTAVASNGVFDVGLILTPVAVYAESKRLKEFSNATDAVAWLDDNGFDRSYHSVHHCVESYFGVDPAPAKVYISCYPTTEDAVTAFEKAVQITNGNFYGVLLANVANNANEEIALVQYIEANNLRKVVFACGCTLEQGGWIAHYDVNGERSVDETVNEHTNTEKAFCDTGYMHAIAVHTTETKTWYKKTAAAMMGLAMGMERTHPTSSFALCYKKLMGIEPDSYEQTEIDEIDGINSNIYHVRGKNIAMLEKGKTASGMRYDEVLYIDEIVSEIQTAILNMLIGNSSKLPQTDATTALFISECNRILENYYNRGILATSPWRGNVIGSVENGDTIEHGYICMADSFNNQSEADREARKAMPITILLCLSGSVESIRITLDVQR